MYIEDSTRTNQHERSGHLTICAEECANSKMTTELVLSCLDLECEDLFGRTVWIYLSSFCNNLDSLPEIIQNIGLFSFAFFFRIDQ